MLTDEEFDKLAMLLKDLHICMGLKFALMDDQAREIFTSSTQTDFCAAVKSAAGGLERCLGCAAAALRRSPPRRRSPRPPRRQRRPVRGSAPPAADRTAENSVSTAARPVRSKRGAE